MPYKCCIPLCNSNYLKSINNGERTIPFYRNPQDEAEKERWIYAIPRLDLRKLLEKNSVVVVCRKHWPDNWKTYTYRGKIRPLEPPSIFTGVNDSCIRVPSKPRETKRCMASVRSISLDEIDQFLLQDSLQFENIEERLVSKKDIITFNSGQKIAVQSIEFTKGVQKFIF